MIEAILFEFPPDFLFLFGICNIKINTSILQDLSLRTNIPLDELKRHLMSLYVNPKAGCLNCGIFGGFSGRCSGVSGVSGVSGFFRVFRCMSNRVFGWIAVFLSSVSSVSS